MGIATQDGFRATGRIALTVLEFYFLSTQVSGRSGCGGPQRRCVVGIATEAAGLLWQQYRFPPNRQFFAVVALLY